MTVDNRTPEEKEKQMAVAANAVKAAGAILILAAPLIAFNVFGIAEAIGMRDGFIEYVLGAALLVAGLVDFFVVPNILKRAIAPKDGDKTL